MAAVIVEPGYGGYGASTFAFPPEASGGRLTYERRPSYEAVSLWELEA